MEIKELKKKDHKKVIQYAIKGMHFGLYLKDKFLLNAYGKYFWYLEYTNATQIIAVYEGDKLYIKFIDFIQKLFFKGGVMPYEEANKEMFRAYSERYTPTEKYVF